MNPSIRCFGTVTLLVCLAAGFDRADAETLCDASAEDCRSPVLALINNEVVGIDVSFWFMEDARYSAALIRRWQAGVPVRVVVDTRANATYPLNATILAQLRDAGVPIRRKTSGGILHRKFMLFAGQNQVEFSGANYSPDAFAPVQPYANYVDEAIYFSDDPVVVNSFKTVFDDMWTATSGYADYANVASTPRRSYPKFPIDPELNFPPGQDYALRAVKRYAAETSRIDVDMYRITDGRHTDALLAAARRGVAVRVYTDVFEYRNPARLWHAYNVDRLWAGGIPVKIPAHAGINHQKSVLLYGQGLTIFGSSNWTSPSANSQAEANYFTTKPFVFNWFAAQFERKWNNTNPAGIVETAPFVPLPPDVPSYRAPANAAAGVASNGVTLAWYGGPWAHFYDVYFGTDPNPPLIATNVNLGPSTTSTQTQSFSFPFLTPGTTYYWRVVSKTAAFSTSAGDTWSFTTAVAPPPVTQTDVPPRAFNLWWQHQSNGLLSISLLSGTTLVNSQVFGQVGDTSWKIVGTGDFNGDGQSDLVWQNTSTGVVGAWLMTGTTLSQAVLFHPAQTGDAAWRIRAVADFDGDGRSDLLWQHTGDGRLAMWLMNGIALAKVVPFGGVSDTNWRIVGAGDLDGDGHADLVWQNQSTGAIGAWLLGGTTVASRVMLGPGAVSDPHWKIEAVGDLDGDGRADLLWHHTISGYIGAWLMNGAVVRERVQVAGIISDNTWRIVGTR